MLDLIVLFMVLLFGYTILEIIWKCLKYACQAIAYLFEDLYNCIHNGK